MNLDKLEEIERELTLARLVVSAAWSLMSEDGAREALAHFNLLHILVERLEAYAERKLP